MHCDMHYKAAVFDMDGTILDTSEDLAAAINYALAKFGHRSDFPVEDVCLFFGSGAHTAVQRALAREAGMSREEILEIGSAVNGAVPGIDENEVLRILEVYQPYYKAHNAIRTRAYPGITGLLTKLREAGVRTGDGLRFCHGDEALYRVVLEEFGRSAEEKTRQLREYYEAEDWKNYGILVHALKSSARTIGAKELSETAEILEKASKQKDTETIRQMNGRMMEQYGSLAEVLGQHLQTGSPDGAADEDVLEFIPEE